MLSGQRGQRRGSVECSGSGERPWSRGETLRTVLPSSLPFVGSSPGVGDGEGVILRDQGLKGTTADDRRGEEVVGVLLGHGRGVTEGTLSTSTSTEGTAKLWGSG